MPDGTDSRDTTASDPIPLPIKSFYYPQSTFRSILSLPGQLFFAIAGFLGLAHYARQIVQICPRSPAIVKKRTGAAVDLNRWVKENVPSLRGSFVPTWWLPKWVVDWPTRLLMLTRSGHFQTMYSVVGNFSKIDKIEYKRWVRDLST
jgi:hypothetical protein